jgi:hypothetical protein
MLVVASAENVAYITGGATVVAALVLGGLAAWTADARLAKQIADSGRRQERELAADADRQQRELDARTKDQKRQLDNARQLADLADLRILLDEAAIALDHGRKARANAEGHLLGIGDAIKKGALTGTPMRPAGVLDPMIQEAADKLEEAGQPLVTLMARLEIRLGSSNEVTAAFGRASTALHDQWNALAVEYPKRGFDAIEEDARHAGQEFGVFKQDFLVAAVKLAGTVPTNGGLAPAEQGVARVPVVAMR